MRGNLTVSISILAITFLFSQLAFAQSPKLAADFSVAISQSLLSAPPLPSLDRHERALIPQGGVVSASVKTISSDAGETTFDKGVDGYSYGLGLVLPANDAVSFYLFAMGSEATGETQASRNGMPLYSVRDIRTRSYAGAGGLSYRFWGSDESVMALGLFAGGAYLKIESESLAQSGNIWAKYYFDPGYYGLYQGLQLMIRLGPVRINPYVLYFANLEKSCQRLTADGVPSMDTTCDGETGKVETHATFKGYGLNFGFKSLLVTVYSNAILTNETIKVDKLSATWGFSF